MGLVRKLGIYGLKIAKLEENFEIVQPLHFTNKESGAQGKDMTCMDPNEVG